jgi:hypothetical protein
MNRGPGKGLKHEALNNISGLSKLLKRESIRRLRRGDDV